MFAACLMIISWQSGVSEEQQRPVTLTIVPIETGGWLIQGGSHPFGVTQASSIHYQIIAELVNGYECYILNRARLYNVGVEDAIRRLSSIDDSPLVGNEIPAADYIVNLLLLQDRESRCWNGKIECVNVCNPAKESVIKTTFTAETDSEIPKKAVLAIACLL